ncbi:hypothetical protein N7492_001825 [Penicillium capsulatum]|uniref:Uncharacterized protein n=1 Tax=Penicillium capsulatum TaxID=69766 RepID=A0A9W9M0M2_9EURO|nr:hypothetical protein N7492_001825 [Penicillium capsulatum]KAJ6129126.1 hypothetical protein N7512_001906 [Penicillium capsulatum]
MKYLVACLALVNGTKVVSEDNKKTISSPSTGKDGKFSWFPVTTIDSKPTSGAADRKDTASSSSTGKNGKISWFPLRIPSDNGGKTTLTRAIDKNSQLFCKDKHGKKYAPTPKPAGNKSIIATSEMTAFTPAANQDTTPIPATTNKHNSESPHGSTDKGDASAMPMDQPTATPSKIPAHDDDEHEKDAIAAIKNVKEDPGDKEYTKKYKEKLDENGDRLEKDQENKKVDDKNKAPYPKDLTGFDDQEVGKHSFKNCKYTGDAYGPGTLKCEGYTPVHCEKPPKPKDAPSVYCTHDSENFIPKVMCTVKEGDRVSAN